MSNQISLRTREIWIQISWESMENRHSPGGILQKGHATTSHLYFGPCVICQANSRGHACAANATGLSRGLRMLGQEVCKCMQILEGPPGAETA